MFISVITALVVVTCMVLPALAQDKAPTQVLVTNVRVFDGRSDKLTDITDVLVGNNIINRISTDSKAGTDATVIDGSGS
jgi:imidazolonepropionase-like amidohydrolase